MSLKETQTHPFTPPPDYTVVLLQLMCLVRLLGGTPLIISEQRSLANAELQMNLAIGALASPNKLPVLAENQRAKWDGRAQNSNLSTQSWPLFKGIFRTDPNPKCLVKCLCALLTKILSSRDL